ncbi:MAG: hypothetical protein QW808_04125 [Desulfurococcaceae archaeon]
MKQASAKVTITARIEKRLRDKLEAYRRKHGLRSLNEALAKILEELQV